MPKISVIMPVYNTIEEYLRIAIESILEQTYTDLELIIVNDGSINNAEDVILSYKDERIRYFKQDNKGVSSARNFGIDQAKGEYVAIADSDDIYDAQRLEKQYIYLSENKEISFLGTSMRINSKQKVIMPKHVCIFDFLSDCNVINATVMFRKTDFDKYNLRYDESLICAEDYDLFARALKVLKGENLEDILFDYRVYDSNTSSSKKRERIISSFLVQDKILNYLTEDKKLQRKLLDLSYTKKRKGKNCFNQIFSIRNLYKNWNKYKLFTILGLEFSVKICSYKKNEDKGRYNAKNFSNNAGL